jgi:hypothetical protein
MIANRRRRFSLRDYETLKKIGSSWTVDQAPSCAVGNINFVREAAAD